MTLRCRTTRVSTSRCVPRLEALESRRLFAVSPEATIAGSVPSGPAALTTSAGLDLGSSPSPGDLSTLSVVQTTPSHGSVINESPTVLIVTFNQPFPSSLRGSDIGLQRLDANGQVVENLTSLLGRPLGLTENSSVLTTAINGVLAPGRYQIVLRGTTSLLTGIPIGDQPGAPLINRGIDQVVSTFTIEQKPSLGSPSTLANATDLGNVVGPVPIVTSGSLVLGNSQYYKFTLAAGHFWQFGAEVTAERDGGTLNSVLTLFDANGNVLESDDLGRPDFLLDPYLFAGLPSGTYYLGVSRSPSVSETPGAHQDDGTYRLHVVAQVADSTTSLLDSQLIYSDPLDPRPTGIVLVFSGPMDLESFKTTAGPGGNGEFKGLELVDANGRSWSLTPTSFNESNSQFTFLFSSPLPKGRYTLRVPALKGVTDLAGRVPVANGNDRANRQNGTLTSWTVQSDYLTQDANDLGTILSDASAAVTKTNTLKPGSSATYRFVVPADGFYTIESTASSESFLIQRSGLDGTTTIPSGPGKSLNSSTMYLTTGVYFLYCKATGSDQVKFSLALFRQPVAPDSILDNGVGQGPALNLLLITPHPLNPTDQGGVPIGSPGPAPSPGPANPGPSAPANPPPASTGSMTTSVSSSATNGLVFTLGSGLIGSPTAGAEHVSAVGPGTLTGTTALAANTQGVLQGIRYGQTLSQIPSNLSGESLLDPSELTPSSVVRSRVSTVGALVAIEPPVAPSQEEREVASPADWLGGLGTMLLHGFWITSGPQSPTAMEAAPIEPIDRMVLSRDDLVEPETDEQVEHANFSAPLGFGLASVLALRLQQPIRRWVERRRINLVNRRSAKKPTVRGPYKRV